MWVMGREFEYRKQPRSEHVSDDIRQHGEYEFLQFLKLLAPPLAN